MTALHLGAADTDIMAGSGYEGDLIDPAEVARLALDGVESDAFEVVADDWSAMVKASLAGEPGAFYRQIGMLSA